MRVLTTSPDITGSRRVGGPPWHESEEAYSRDVLGLASWRTAYRRLAIGRMLTSSEERDRAGLRVALAKAGLARAAMGVPAIERLGQWRTWLKGAGEGAGGGGGGPGSPPPPPPAAPAGAPPPGPVDPPADSPAARPAPSRSPV